MFFLYSIIIVLLGICVLIRCCNFGGSFLKITVLVLDFLQKLILNFSARVETYNWLKKGYSRNNTRIIIYVV